VTGGTGFTSGGSPAQAVDVGTAVGVAVLVAVGVWVNVAVCVAVNAPAAITCVHHERPTVMAVILVTTRYMQFPFI
jgi:hypothetical protein